MDRRTFENSIKGSAREYYLDLSVDKIVELFGEEIGDVAKYGEQNNSHHQYSLFEHILRTVDEVQDENLGADNLLKVKIAAFFHDIGKPLVVSTNEKQERANTLNMQKNPQRWLNRF